MQSRRLLLRDFGIQTVTLICLLLPYYYFYYNGRDLLTTNRECLKWVQHMCIETRKPTLGFQKVWSTYHPCSRCGDDHHHHHRRRCRPLTQQVTQNIISGGGALVVGNNGGNMHLSDRLAAESEMTDSIEGAAGPSAIQSSGIVCSPRSGWR